MFEFLKKLMINNKSVSANETNSLHRILNTDIREVPKSQADEIIFGCGCFWGAEKCFWKLPGVITTSVGYAGGEKKNPNYYEVCSGITGHAEVVRVVWNVNEIDISDLLKMFWECHNPTQKNRQGNDIGTQYRSGAYYFSKTQMLKITETKEAYQKALCAAGFGSIVTEIKEAPEFFLAEDYHQQYLAKNPQGYCGLGGTGISLKEKLETSFRAL